MLEHWDEELNVLTDTLHKDLADAEEQAHFEFAGIALMSVGRD